MAVRQRRSDIGAAVGRRLVLATAHEFKAARTASGLSQRSVAEAAGISRPQYGRIERGLAPEISIERIAVVAAALGLEPTLRLYPNGDPIRDEGHASLLERLHVRCHSSLIWRTEVPLPAPGDRRAWDALIRGVEPVSNATWRAGVEAETRPNDLQALDRKLALKERDGETDWLILLLLASRHNRALVRDHGAVLRARFPIDGRRALQRLGVGAPLGGNALILL